MATHPGIVLIRLDYAQKPRVGLCLSSIFGPRLADLDKSFLLLASAVCELSIIRLPKSIDFG